MADIRINSRCLAVDPKLRYFNASYLEYVVNMVTNGTLILPWNGLTSLVTEDRRAEDIFVLLQQICTHYRSRLKRASSPS